MSHSRFARRLFVVCLLVAFFSLVAAAQSNLFTTTTPNSVGAGPTAMAYGDFNGDGRIDLAVADFTGGSVSILLGTGDGNFQPTVDYPVSRNVAAIVTGDFNHDGNLDLAVATESNLLNNVYVFLGQGNGNFTQSAIYLAGAFSSAIGVFDFNGDGNLDLAVTSFGQNIGVSPGLVTIFLGRSDGSFQYQATYTVGTVANAIAVGDFNGDGKADLAVGTDGSSTSPSSQVSILLGDGAGNFQAGAVLTAPGGLGVASVATADFNGDGKLDLAALSSSDTLSIFISNGDGTFAAPILSSVGRDALGIAAADLNGDGRIDVAVANSFDNTVSVLLGKGDGTFQTQITYAVGKVPSGVALVDFNGDGKVDLTVTNNGDNTVQVLLGGGDGTFRIASYSVGPNPVSITSGDFNRDGIPDLAIGRNDSSTGSILILLGDGRGGFKTLPPFSACVFVAEVGPPGALVSADFDQDGIPDLAVLCDSSAQQANVAYFKGAGNGTFQSVGESDFGMPITSMVVADINGDAIQDLFFTLSGNFYAFPEFPDPQGVFSAQIAVQGVAGSG
ncbi:MAG: FG-GAP repeat domain-containing protein, partial [Candidatus Sulfotelmatobacter sp.]